MPDSFLRSFISFISSIDLFFGCMTEKNRFGLSKPVVTTSGETSLSSVFISSLTAPVAVAVNAPTTGRELRASIKSGILDSSGEILTPLRDAVCLVDRDHGYIEIAAYSEKSGRAEPLRCDINYFIFAALRVLQHFQILRVGQ